MILISSLQHEESLSHHLYCPLPVRETAWEAPGMGVLHSAFGQGHASYTNTGLPDPDVFSYHPRLHWGTPSPSLVVQTPGVQKH